MTEKNLSPMQKQRSQDPYWMIKLMENMKFFKKSSNETWDAKVVNVDSKLPLFFRAKGNKEVVISDNGTIMKLMKAEARDVIKSLNDEQKLIGNVMAYTLRAIINRDIIITEKGSLVVACKKAPEELLAGAISLFTIMAELQEFNRIYPIV